MPSDEPFAAPRLGRIDRDVEKLHVEVPEPGIALQVDDLLQAAQSPWGHAEVQEHRPAPQLRQREAAAGRLRQGERWSLVPNLRGLSVGGNTRVVSTARHRDERQGQDPHGEMPLVAHPHRGPPCLTSRQVFESTMAPPTPSSAASGYPATRSSTPRDMRVKAPMWEIRCCTPTRTARLTRLHPNTRRRR